jgi:hypothetical protein
MSVCGTKRTNGSGLLMSVDRAKGSRVSGPPGQLLTQAVWKRFSYPNNCKQPAVMDLDATGWAYFCCIEPGVNPGASGRAERS